MSTVTVILAFAAVYIVWGSTYFFIQVAVREFVPMILGSVPGYLLLSLLFSIFVALQDPGAFNITISGQLYIAIIIALLVGKFAGEAGKRTSAGQKVSELLAN